MKRPLALTVVPDYGTVDEAVATFGFIYGRRAIDHLQTHAGSRVRWRLRIYEWRVGREGG